MTLFLVIALLLCLWWGSSIIRAALLLALCAVPVMGQTNGLTSWGGIATNRFKSDASLSFRTIIETNSLSIPGKLPPWIDPYELHGVWSNRQAILTVEGRQHVVTLESNRIGTVRMFFEDRVVTNRVYLSTNYFLPSEIIQFTNSISQQAMTNVIWPMGYRTNRFNR